MHKFQSIVGTASLHRTCFPGGMRKTCNARVSERHAMKEGDRNGGIPQHDDDEEEHVKDALEPPAMAAARHVTEPNCIFGRMLWPDKYLGNKRPTAQNIEALCGACQARASLGMQGPSGLSFCLMVFRGPYKAKSTKSVASVGHTVATVNYPLFWVSAKKR
jgi:hypothetical protein